MKRIRRASVDVKISDEAKFLKHIRGIEKARTFSRGLRTTLNPVVPYEEWLSYEVRMPADLWDNVWPILAEHALHRVGMSDYYEECVFTKSEIDSAELLVVVVNRSPLRVLDAQDGMIYDYKQHPTDYNPAPWCWQKTPRLMRMMDLPKTKTGLHQTIPGEILIHGNILKSESRLRDKYMTFGPVLASGEVSNWYQLIATRVMPPYHKYTTGIEVAESGESPPPTSPPNIYDNALEGYWPAYDRADVFQKFSYIPAATFTYELYGRWDLNHQDHCQLAPPQPRLLVNQQVKRELTAAGVSRLNYTPVRLVE